MEARDAVVKRRIDLSDRQLALVVIGVTLLLPVLLTLTVWPTAMGDLRQQIAWGRWFPLVTPRHPPMMVWLVGIVDHVFGPQVIPQLIAGQVLIAIGAVYVYQILRLATEEDNAFLFFFLYITAFFVFLGPNSWVMNADMLQVTSWPAIVYHFLQAARSNRWRHWLALGVWSAAAVLSKYTAAVLFASMLIASVAVSDTRVVFRRLGLYVAILLGVLLVTPHAIALLHSPGAFEYGAQKFESGHSLEAIRQNFWQFTWGYIQIGFPAWLIVPIAMLRGDLGARRPRNVAAPWPDALRFVVILNVAMFAILVLLIGFVGLWFRYHFNLPFVTMAFLGLGPLFAWKPGRQPAGEALLVKSVGLLNVGVVAFIIALYTFFTAHNIMQEPVEQPTRTILSAWKSTFGCGPAYIFGEDRPAHMIANHSGTDLTSIAFSLDLPRTPWFHPDKLRRLGAIVVRYDPITDDDVLSRLPGVTLTDEQTFTAPLRWTLTGQTITYHYRFIPPQDCSPAPPG